MVTVVIELLRNISLLTSIVLIVGGIFSCLWFLERVASVYNKNLQEWIKFIAYGGFIVGIIVLFVIAIDLVAPYFSETGKQTGWDIIIIGLVLGVSICLRPIKDMKWAALISLVIGVISMILIWFIVPSDVAPYLIGLALGLMFVFYMSVKFVEDIYSIIGNVLSAPPVALGIGLLAILEGVLLLFGTSLKALVGL